MGLLAAGEVESESVRRGVDFLLETQNEDGTWDEPWFTGTGFPRVFFLKYHLYRIYFPLMALARYARVMQNG
jgi:squalene-hopene/tetraprenyl-beta-curcumene cyclase